jgi:hypothetical protein
MKVIAFITCPARATLLIHPPKAHHKDHSAGRPLHALK